MLNTGVYRLAVFLGALHQMEEVHDMIETLKVHMDIPSKDADYQLLE